MLKILLAAFVVSFLILGSAFGDGLDPPIFIGSPSCAAPPGCPVYSGEVNGITGNTFTLDQAGGPNPDILVNPVLLMIGVPNDNGTFSAPNITLSSGTGSLGGTPPLTLAWNSTTGFAGAMTSGGPITDAYQALGLSDPAATSGNSESFVNWSAADSAVLHLTTTSFGVYVYKLTDPGLTGKNSTVNVTFNSSLPNGTFVVAYGCVGGFPCSGGDIFATPFTQSGLEVPPGTVAVPEPATLLVLGCDLFGLAGLAGIFRRRLKFRIS